MTKANFFVNRQHEQRHWRKQRQGHANSSQDFRHSERKKKKCLQWYSNPERHSPHLQSGALHTSAKAQTDDKLC